MCERKLRNTVTFDWNRANCVISGLLEVVKKGIELLIKDDWFEKMVISI